MNTRRILVISADRVGTRMAGPSIRAYELARALRPSGDVVLAGLNSEDASATDPLDVPVVSYDLRDPRALRTEIAAADVVVCQPQWPPIATALRKARARVVFDLYTPEQLETLERDSPARSVMAALVRDRIADAFQAGSHFICATERQRDLWIGTLLEQRLLRPDVYDADPTLRDRIRVVPFGLPAAPPVAAGSPIRDRFPVVDDDDQIVLWNGGIWDWFDAPTAVRAVAQLSLDRPKTRLVFMGAANSGPGARATAEAKRVADELGVLGTNVLFNDQWVAYDERASWLLEADCAIATHLDQTETRFAFRTRLLDCFWSGLPIVCTDGDEIARRVDESDLGRTAAERDVEAVTAGLREVLDRGRSTFESRIATVAQEYRWDAVVLPLVELLDRADPGRLGAHVPRRAAHQVRSTAFTAAVVAAHRLGVGLPEL